MEAAQEDTKNRWDMESSGSEVEQEENLTEEQIGERGGGGR